ncbi:exopolyphosphatase [Paenibacillus sp. y28]|uniref:exopolyphosphatase n=1 Tax=Paenibacillus sp. y28 TaxID=3129110 RepID=UPI0030163832
MNGSKHIGIIDIGSNSIRLVIYELTEQAAYRVIDESKESARLSQRINEAGILPDEELADIVDILRHFQLLCRASRVDRLRAVATAAIRNAANSGEIVAKLEAATGLTIEVLSGEEEARLGFIATMNTLDIKDGFLVDIGGGSTEITLFLDRKLQHSVSLPFGAVNTAKRFTPGGHVTDTDIASIRHMIKQALEEHTWLRGHAGLPLIGLGGTFRTLAKVHQRQRKYSLPLTHNYDLSREQGDSLFHWIASQPLAKRKKIDGLSAERADIIVPGIVILHTIFMQTEASHFIISGSGLRDGLFFEMLYPQQPVLDDVLAHGVSNLLALHPSIPLNHVQQVNRLALKIADDLMKQGSGITASGLRLLSAAALLYRIGVSVSYYDYQKHTFYLIAHSRLGGLSHREIIKCALIASYKSKSRNRQQALAYKDLLNDTDLEETERLGTLLQLAIALDRSETGPIAEVDALVKDIELVVSCSIRHQPTIEKKEMQAIAKEFTKVWLLIPRLIVSDASS